MSETLNVQTPHSLLAHWSFTSTHATVATIFPDGCCDLIFIQGPTDAGQWLISSLADTAYSVPSAPSERFEGFRFQPGAHIDASGLLAATARNPVLEQAKVFDLIDQFVRLDDRISQALSALANASSCRHRRCARLRRPSPFAARIQTLVRRVASADATR